MPAQLVYAIHGFLGETSDWDETKKYLKLNSKSEINFVSEDLFSKNSSGILDFCEQSELMIKRIKMIPHIKGKKILIGYSLGGRLALHLLKTNPDLFDHYIFISTNSGIGIDANAEKKNRLINDKKWSEKLKSENWNEFISEWNQQPVFNSSSAEPKRNLVNYDIDKLKESLVKWSLGGQEDFSEVIQLFNFKISWVVGSEDIKYCELAENLKNKNIIQNYIQIKSGHRVWLDNPEELAQLITDALSA